MSNIADAAQRRIRPAALAAGLHTAAIAGLSALALLASASLAEAAAPPQAYCMPELAQLSAEWDAIGFRIPQKPSQQIVHSRLGLISSGPEVTFMKEQLRQAFWDCEHGYVAAARARAALVAEHLSELW
jgi:hypothetical protein